MTVLNTPQIRQTRKAGWVRGWTDAHIRQVWDEKMAQRAWLTDPAYRIIAEACADCGSVLDIGCGGGMQYAGFREFAPRLRYTGVDIHPGMLAYARRAFPEGDFWEGDATDLQFADDQFGVAVLRQVIEHYKPPWVRLILTEAVRVARERVVLYMRLIPFEGSGVVKLGTRGNFDWNQYAAGWLEQTLFDAIGGDYDLEVTDVPWFEGSPASGDHQVWVVSYD